MGAAEAQAANEAVNESTDDIPEAIRQMQGKTRRTIKGGGGKKREQILQSAVDVR